MDEETKYVVRKVVIDVVCLFLVGFPVLIFYLFAHPYKRGFFCDDYSIRLPLKDSTVSNVTLYIVGLGLPITVMLLLELVIYRRTRNHTVHSAFGYRIHPWLWRCYCVIGVFGFGAACSQLTTDFGKYIIGRLRPHFIAACNPDIVKMCDLEQYKGVYIEDFTCSDPSLEKKARLSFPSGHSSFSFYTMFYLAIYLQKNFTWGGSKLLKPLLQFTVLSMAFCTALSRVSDNKHHWSDVLAGSLLGIIVALLVAYFISDLCEKRFPLLRTQSDKDGKENTEGSSYQSNHGMNMSQH
ncbi:putative phosphatidate phosphatase isoform X2 [Lycorma delicatula]|uniref:putative phosphatidate phosphatase isoform X2 n=1 Tax=Lycorma delicatula TaxID=130591 RepID=UPI003F513A9C